MITTYYILTSKRRKNILCTKDINETFEFILKNKDTKIRLIDHSAKPRILWRRTFIENFIKLTGEEAKGFQLAEILIKGQSNLDLFLVDMGKREEFKRWRKLTNKLL
jgi:hypothetical protein